MPNAPIFSLTEASNNENPLLAARVGILRCQWESNSKFSVEWTYRNERNILLSEITIRRAQFSSTEAAEKRTIELYKDGILKHSRSTAHATVKFYKMGRGLSSRFKIKTEGYLREVELTDTEGWQK